MPRRATVTMSLFAGAVVLAAAAHAPAAAARTEMVADLGSTFAVSGDPNNGGVSLALSLLWPIDERFRVGVMGCVDDMGVRVGRLEGPNGEDLGPATDLHRMTGGIVVRMEALLPGHAIEPLLSATWGMYRVSDDVGGTDLEEDVTPGVGLGLGGLYPLNARHAVGLLVRGQWLTRGAVESYVSAALEWRWGIGGP